MRSDVSVSLSFIKDYHQIMTDLFIILTQKKL